MFKYSSTHLTKVPKREVIQWLNSIETIICDADGVLWHFEKAIDGAVDTFNMLKEKGKKCYIVSNNAGNTIEELVAKAHQFGVNVGCGEMKSSSLSIANYLKCLKFKKKVYVVGEAGIVKELAKVGICAINKTPEKPKDMTMKQFASELELDPNVGAVVVGKDEDFNVPKIVMACTYLLDPNVLFLATCRNAAYPLLNGRMLVGAAAMVAAVKTISRRKPLILGKPNPFILNDLRNVIKPESTLMIGDTLHTDMLFAHNCCFHSMLVGTGVSTLAEVERIKCSEDETELSMIPDTYAPSLAFLQILCDESEDNMEENNDRRLFEGDY